MEPLLTMLKTDLGILTTTLYDQRLTQYLQAAYTAIRQEGATTLNLDDALDAQLIVWRACPAWCGGR